MLLHLNYTYSDQVFIKLPLFGLDEVALLICSVFEPASQVLQRSVTQLAIGNTVHRV